jgi:hypothetical protein
VASYCARTLASEANECVHLEPRTSDLSIAGQVVRRTRGRVAAYRRTHGGWAF